MHANGIWTETCVKVTALSAYFDRRTQKIEWKKNVFRQPIEALPWAIVLDNLMKSLFSINLF